MRILRPLFLFAVAASILSAQRLPYPQTRKSDHVDIYHGTQVADPYRWLEDDNAAETAAWVDQENKVTFGYLQTIPFRARLKQRLEELYNYPKYSAPFRKGEKFFFYKNNGLQNQSVLYVQQGLNGKPEVFLDPNTWSTDGTVRLTVFALSKDGTYAGCGLSRNGSDWQEYFVMDVAAKKPIGDTLHWVKVSGLAWYKDGFYYSRYDAPTQGHELSSKNENHKIYYHRIGTTQAQDELVYQDPAHPQRFNFIGVSEDERFAFLTYSERGSGKKGNALYYRNLAGTAKSFTPIIAEITDDDYSVVDNIGDLFLIETNHKAPNGRVFLFDPAKPGESDWKDVLPEQSQPLQSTSTAGGKLFATYLKDVATHAFVYDLKGKLENEIPLPGLGAAGGFGGERDDKFVFYSYTSFDFPPAIFRYDIAEKKSSLFQAPEIPGYHPEAYETKQVFYPSKDGTQIPMFLVYKKGLKLDGTNPTLLYAYGGFNITTSPSFSSLRIALLEQGFVYASANIRGGGEYGEKWHEAGTKLNKQNVFDDFIAAAEWLIAGKYTSSKNLAILGGSNGGLLIGAVMNQRPELFKVAIPQVGVMDMLRFHKFTIGWNWIPDYGSSDSLDQFKALYAYSPLHNIKTGVAYPATLITTADHDDRVVPAHSFKYAATLQEKGGGPNPLLIRVETKSGHGASSTTKALELTSDIYSFIMFNLGVKPVY